MRLNNSPSFGFAKRDDLSFFLEELCGASTFTNRCSPRPGYTRRLQKGKRGMVRYERRFLELMRERRIEETLDRKLFEEAPTALLCSEVGPERCHRRLILEYLDREWGDIQAVHL